MNSIERSAMLAHSMTARFQKLERRTLDELSEMLSRHKAVVSWSGGKDSTVCVHLANRVAPGTPAAFLDSGGEHPLSRGWIAQAAQQMGVRLSIEDPRLTYPELLELAYEFGENGAYLPGGAVREFIIHETSGAACERFGADAYILGLRKEESGHRALSIAVHGKEHLSAKSGLTRLLPIARWQTEDVLAYLVKHKLPIHPAYTDERLQGERLEQIRVGVITDPTAQYTGPTWQKLKLYHPQEFERLRQRLPNVPWPI